MSSYSHSLQQQVDRQKHDAQRRFSSWFVNKFKKETKPSLRNQDEATIERERSERLRRQKLTAVTNITHAADEYVNPEEASASMNTSSAAMKAAQEDAMQRQHSYLRSQLKEMKRLSHEALLRHRRSVEAQVQEVKEEDEQQRESTGKVSDSDEDEEDVTKVEEGDEALLSMKETAPEEPVEEEPVPVSEEVPEQEETPEGTSAEETKDDAPDDNQTTDNNTTHKSLASSRRSSMNEDTPSTSRQSSLEDDNNTPRSRDRRGSTPEDIERRMAQAQLLYEEAMLLAEQALHAETPVPSPAPRIPPPPPKPPVTNKLTKPGFAARPPRRVQTVQKAVFAQPDNEWI